MHIHKVSRHRAGYLLCLCNAVELEREMFTPKLTTPGRTKLSSSIIKDRNASSDRRSNTIFTPRTKQYTPLVGLVTPSDIKNFLLSAFVVSIDQPFFSRLKERLCIVPSLGYTRSYGEFCCIRCFFEWSLVSKSEASISTLF